MSCTTKSLTGLHAVETRSMWPTTSFSQLGPTYYPIRLVWLAAGSTHLSLLPTDLLIFLGLSTIGSEKVWDPHRDGVGWGQVVRLCWPSEFGPKTTGVDQALLFTSSGSLSGKNSDGEINVLADSSIRTIVIDLDNKMPPTTKFEIIQISKPI